VNSGVLAPPNVVCRIGTSDVPTRVRSLCTFDEPDYIDSFTLHSLSARDLTAEGWARAVLEEAELSRRSARRLWRLMGLRLGPPPYSAEHVQGWAIADAGAADWIRLETQSWYVSAEVVCVIDHSELSISLSLRFDHDPVASVVWALVRCAHQRAVPVMLRQALELVTDLSSQPATLKAIRPGAVDPIASDD
jgi:hypothetical protein